MICLQKKLLDDVDIIPKYTVRRMFVSIIKMIDKKNINIFFLFQYARLEYSTISKSSIKKVKECYNKNKEKNNIVKKLNNERQHIKEIAIERRRKRKERQIYKKKKIVIEIFLTKKIKPKKVVRFIVYLSIILTLFILSTLFDKDYTRISHIYIQIDRHIVYGLLC